MLSIINKNKAFRKTDFFGELVTVDNFSTYRNGNPIGDQRFIWVDTVSKQWGFADGNGEPEKQPNPRLDIRNYKVGDRVKFKIRYHGSDKEEIHDGAVEIIDHYPGGHGSIDVMSSDIFYKHLPLEKVIEHIGNPAGNERDLRDHRCSHLAEYNAERTC